MVDAKALKFSIGLIDFPLEKTSIQLDRFAGFFCIKTIEQMAREEGKTQDTL